jgi:hypothetical protein
VSRVRLSWPGWGTFRIQPEAGPSVVVDPCLTRLLDDPVATEREVIADVVLLTHGHHEHIIDAHRVGRLLPRAPFVAPPQVVDYLVTERRMQRQRFDVMEPDGVVELPGLRVTGRSFPHLPKHDVAGKLAILGRHHAVGAARILARYGRRVAASWLAIRRQPEQGPFLAYDLDFDGGPRIFVTCEAFTELLDPAEAQRWGRGARPIDLAIVGVESGRERVAGELLDRLAPRRAVAAAIHAPFERFYGRPAVDPTGFSSSVSCAFQAPGWSASLET